MKCSICRIGEAIIDKVYGVLPCTSCTQKPHSFTHKQIEFTSNDIKEQRKQYREDILPPHRLGELDKGWLLKYGKKKALERGFSEKEINSAKFVFSGFDQYYKK